MRVSPPNYEETRPLLTGEAAVLQGHVYIDGGEFSYQKENDTVYEYCMKTISELPVTPLTHL